MVVIGLVSNWPVMGWTIVGHSWINTGGCGWINTGSIRGEKAAKVAAIKAAAEVVMAVVWFIGR